MRLPSTKTISKMQAMHINSGVNTSKGLTIIA